MRVNIIFILFVLFIVVSSVLYAVSIYNHEKVHEQIFIHDGCENVQLHFGLHSYSICLDSDYTESETARLSHNMNEVVGYNATTIVFIFILFLGFWLIKE